jgi:hypothetical protein
MPILVRSAKRRRGFLPDAPPPLIKASNAEALQRLGAAWQINPLPGGGFCERQCRAMNDDDWIDDDSDALYLLIAFLIGVASTCYTIAAFLK